LAYSSFDTKEINAKVVYFGAQSAGKSENLRSLHRILSQPSGASSLAKESISDVVLDQQVFEFLPVALGNIKDFDVRLHLYTLPTVEAYAGLEQVILKGIDGAVFVVDSRAASLTENLQAAKEMEQKLAEQGLSLSDLPVVLQFNHRDDAQVMATEALKHEFSRTERPSVEAVAVRSEGTMETFNLIAGEVLKKLGQLS